MITLRPMTMNDADRMLEWKNYPETRMFALVTHDKIERKHHIKWLAKNLMFFRIIMCDGEVCGAVRVQDSEISIWIDRAFWGKGLATGTIKMVSKEGYTAKIALGNIASMKCFIKAGYIPISYRGEYLLFQC
jgi:RimJ/RimL family protein N-acetyltransferase